MGDWPFRGRQAEHHRLQAWLADGEFPGAIVAGDSGVGKSRLAAEFLRSAERAGWSPASVRATRSSTGQPFGALAPLLPSLGTATAGRRPIVLIDDAHLLDDFSATLVYQLAATGTAFVLLTVRANEPAPDATLALWKEGITPRLQLEGFDEDAVDDLLAAGLGGPVDRACVADLARRCQGNLLYLRELVTAALSDGSLVNEGGVWVAVGPISPSGRIIELVEARLADLSPPERDILELVCLAETLGPAELIQVSNVELASVLERKGFLVSRLEGRRLRLRVGHPIHGEVLRGRLPAVATRRLTEALADAVEAAGARRWEDPLRIGTWRLNSGGGRPEMMMTAAATARRRYDHALSERLARAAAEVGAGFEAALLAAESRALQGGAVGAEDELRRLATEATTDDQRARVALARLDNDAFFMGRMEDALAIAQEAEATLGEPSWRAAVTARRCAIVLAIRGPKSAAEVALPLTRTSSGWALTWSRVIASYSLGRMGRLRDAIAMARDGAVTDQEDHLRWYHVFTECEALAQAGDFQEAERLARREYLRSIEEHGGEAQGYFAWQRAKTVGERGHVHAAIRLGREAVALFRRVGRRTTIQDSLTHLALALALAGRAEEAGGVLEEIDELNRPAASWTALDLTQARGWTAVARGDLPGARSIFRQAASTGEDIGDLVGAACALHALARIGRPGEAAELLDELAVVVEGEFVAARARHTGALARNDAPELMASAQTFEALGAVLLAAEAAADAAAVWQRAGDSRAAAAAQRRSALLGACCEGATTPALQGIGRRVRLTPAEREAALLAAGGRSNREIADALYLSVRTVEGRLQRVYEKFGVSSRRELTGALESW